MKVVRNWALAILALGLGYTWISSASEPATPSYSQYTYTAAATSPTANPVVTEASVVTRAEVPTPTPTPTPAPVTPAPTATLSNSNYYVNDAGDSVHSPAYSDDVPVGATAKCGDGTYSFSQSRRGTCSHHGGVARWL